MYSGSVLLRFWHYPVMTLGPGRRLGLWFQGCDIHCDGCIAPELQDFNEKYSVPIAELMSEVSPVLSEASGITISGGEPTCQLEALLSLLEHFNRIGTDDILLYTGRKIGEIPADVLELVSAVIDGSFVKGDVTPAKWKGSENQTLTILREEFRSIYEQWQEDNTRNVQLVSKGDEKFLIGIPRQEDNVRAKLMTKMMGG